MQTPISGRLRAAYHSGMRFVLASLLLSGCLASGSADVTYGGGVAVAPVDANVDLVTVSPGVQVVADYDDDVFYSDGYYWHYDNGGWYRSTYYSGGWTYWASPPSAIIRINDPYRYRHYRPAGYQPRHRPYRQPEPVVRDHRAPEPRREPPREGGVEVRDHREPIREERHEEPRPAPGPVVRDHREPAPAPRREEPKRPVVRDHRD